MEKKSQDFSVEEAKRLASTPEGQRLLAILQGSDTAQLQKAMDAAAAGNYKAAGAALQQLLRDPEAQKLIRQLGGKHGGF